MAARIPAPSPRPPRTRAAAPCPNRAASSGSEAGSMGLWGWILFAVPVLAMLVLDLRAASRGGGKDPTLRSAALWTSAWIGLALLFGLAVYALHGAEAAVAYLTAYVVEESLSVDNIFVFVLIFSELHTPAAQQRRVLYWGIIGAVLLRAAL